MNKQRRKKLEKAFEMIGEVKDILEEVKGEEEEAYENLPESFQNGERGEEMQGYIEMIDEAYGYLEDAESVVEQI
ncbi:MAG: hypothetical protein ACI4EO_01910 [Blautia sp.]